MAETSGPDGGLMAKMPEMITYAPFLRTVFAEPRFKQVTLKHVKSLPGAELDISVRVGGGAQRAVKDKTCSSLRS